MSIEREIDDVVETLKAAKGRGEGCCLLIGAGCSVRAGIPTAQGFVERIEQDYPVAYRRAPEKTYPQCMAELLIADRRHLIADYVDNAKINWAHIGIARLIQEGYVDRVLTTNFDPLVARACALLNEFPAVYDFATSQLYRAADIPTKAIFHLHGQRTGFVLMNTKEECDALSERMAPVFEDAGRGRLWIIVGYSGDNDPVFDHLAQVERFDRGLYWVGYKDNEPGRHVREQLLSPDKSAFAVKGYDADSFFVNLTQNLEIFPPQFLETPFTYLGGLIDLLTPYDIPGQDSSVDVTEQPQEWITAAIGQFEGAGAVLETTSADSNQAKGSAIENIEARVTKLFMEGRYEDIDRIYAELPADVTLDDNLANIMAWSETKLGNQIAGNAITSLARGANEVDSFDLAGKKYEAALAIKPDMHDALYNWGNTLSKQANTKTGEDADRLYALAGEKFEAALAIEPDKHEALNNWGAGLGSQAKTKTGEDADRLYALAGEKFEAALVIKPDKHEALTNWGTAILNEYQHNVETGNIVGELLEEAEQILRRGEAIKSGSSSYNLACLYAIREDEAQTLEWLENAQKHGKLPDRAHLIDDPDLSKVRDTPWFQEFLSAAFPDES